MKKNLLRIFTLAVLCLFFVGGSVLAQDGMDVSVPSGEKIEGDFIQAGETVDVAGDVSGDVILAGGNVSFSGNAGGDIIVLGGNVRIKGDTGGDLRIIGGTVTLDGAVEKNVTLIGGSVILEEGSMVKGNLYIVGENVELRGKVKGDATAYGSKVLFSGEVDKNADFRASDVVLRSDASVVGDLTYAIKSDFTLENKQIVQGQTFQTELQQYFGEDDKKEESGFSLGFELWQFLSLFLVAWIFFKLFKRQAEQLISPIEKKEVWNRVASGLLSLLLNPVIILISFITIIGIPVAMLILFVYILLLVAASTLSPVLVGKMLNDKFKLYVVGDRRLWVDFALGYLVIQIIGLIPILGGFALFFLFLFSFGRVARFVYGEVRKNRQTV
jgi:hypothetical protein